MRRLDAVKASGRAGVRRLRALVKLARGPLAHGAASGWLAWSALATTTPARATALATTAAALSTTPPTTTVATLAAVLVLVVPGRAVMIIADRTSIPGVTIARGELDLELVELVPLLVSALAVGNRQQLLHASAR